MTSARVAGEGLGCSNWTGFPNNVQKSSMGSNSLMCGLASVSIFSMS